MKFWKKIFSYSVILFISLLALAGVILVEKTFEDNLQEAVIHAIGKCSDVENSLYLNADYLLDVNVANQDDIRDWIDVIIKGYMLNMNKSQFKLEVYTKDNYQILSDWEQDLGAERPELSVTEQSGRCFYIRSVQGERYVFIGTMLNIRNTNFKLVLSTNIEQVYENRKEDYEFFSMLSLGICTLLAIGMYLVSIRLTRPIRRLSESANGIARGEYETRVVETGGKDEIEVLSKNFNRMAEVIEEKITELNEHNEAKQRFIDSLNHEIKTPITSIIGYSDLLLRSKVDEKTMNQALHYINSEARRISILNKVLMQLTLLRKEGTMLEWVSLSSCVGHAMDAMNFKLEQSGNAVELNMEEVEVQADKSQLEVLFTNLIDNACKASADGQTIEIRGEHKGEEEGYHLIIEDHGIGIAKEDLGKITEPFYMADKARTRKENGLGLGLAICSEICKANEITMSFESELGQGTKVTVVFGKEGVAR